MLAWRHQYSEARVSVSGDGILSPQLETLKRRKLVGSRSKETLVHYRVQRHAQLFVIIVAQRDEAKRLQTAFRELVQWTQHFSHALDRTRTGLESDLNEITLAQRLPEKQQTAGD
jgi:hypothetical protein